MPTDDTDEVKKPSLGWYRRLSPPWPLAWHLGALVASVALPALLLGAYLLNQQHQAELAVIERDAMARAEAMSHATDAAVMGIISTLKAIGGNPSLESDDFADFVGQSKASFGGVGIVVTLLDEKFALVKSTQPTSMKINLMASDQLFAEGAFKSHKPQISNHSLGGERESDHVVRVWVPVGLDTQRKLLLEAMIPAKFFNQALLDNQLPFGWSAGTSDRNDRIIARTDDYERFVGKLISEDTRRNTIGPAGIMRSTDLLGRPTMQAYLHSSLTGWRMSTWAPTDLLEARARENWTNFMLMGGTLMAFAALSAWLWASRMTGAVLELAESARRMQSDRLLDEVTTPVLEINKLRDTISAGAAELIRRKQALSENEERLRLALHAGGMGVWEWDPQTDITHWDKALFQQTGFDSQITQGSGKAYIDRIHPDDVHRVEVAIAATLENGEPFSVEHRFRRPDGEARWFAVRGAIYKDSNNARPRFMGVHFDISDEKESAARTKALLLEVSHRSKNLLAVILAMGRLTLRNATTVKAYEHALGLRIRALAATQDLIVDSDWKGVALEPLVLSQLGAVVNDKVARASVTGPAVTLNPTAAQNVGMAIAELALNALEHGAFSNDRGMVAVAWHVSPPEHLDKVLLTWIERDGPPVTPLQKRGYGVAIVERLVAQSLKAEAKMEFASDGLRWTFVAPYEALVADHLKDAASPPENPPPTT